MITIVEHVDIKNPTDCPFQYYAYGGREPICSYTRAICKPLGKTASDLCPLKGNTQVIVTPEPKGGS